jgi:hypothetical protein
LHGLKNVIGEHQFFREYQTKHFLLIFKVSIAVIVVQIAQQGKPVAVRIPFPKTEKLIEQISLSDYYYDLTFQDFSDDKLIQELKKKQIIKDEDIKGIVDMKNAFAEKK